MEERNAQNKNMLYLISCALHETAPERERIKDMDLSALYQTAAAHSLTAMVCMALESADAFSTADPEIEKRWKDAKNKAIRKNMLLDAEREQILGEMEQAGIWYMPLKGCILKELYPKCGMRQMADNDILYDASRQKDLMNVFVRRGYRVERVGKSNHDIYLKPPVYNFEMHTALFGATVDKSWVEFYRDVKKRLRPDENRRYGYHFTDEDFYVYFMAHAYKHYKNSGTGLRTLVDVYVLHWKEGELLDREYVRAELEKLGIAEFEEQNRRLAEKMFGAASPLPLTELTEEERGLLFYYCGSGTYGTLQTKVKNKLRALQPEGEAIRKGTKLRYYCSRVFPGREWCKMVYPFFYRYPCFLPALWIYRLVRILLFGRRKLGNEIRAVEKAKE